MTKPIYPTRKEAQAQGLIRYTGKPCKNCGNTSRYVRTGNCINCKKIHQQAPKQKAYQKDYWKVYLQSQKQIAYRHSPKWKALQKAYHKDYWKMYCRSSKGKAVRQVATQKNRAKRLEAEGFFTTQEWIDLKESYGNLCLCCKLHQSKLDGPLEPDHIIPITRGGTNWITNIQPLCHNCNGMGCKGTKTIDYRSQQTSGSSNLVSHL